MILLDTHTLVWWHHGSPRLSAAAKRAIDRQHRFGSIAISSLTCWELALLVAHGKISLSVAPHTWIASVESINHVSFIPVDRKIRAYPHVRTIW